MTAMRNSATFLVRAAFGGVFAIFFLSAGATSALAQQQQEEEDLSPEQSLIKKFLGGFGASTGGADIEYRERSPLVIPPSTELPPPENRPPLASNPAWPKDADVRRRQESAAAAKAVSDRSRDGDILDPSRPLPRDALNGNPRLQTGPRPPSPPPSATNDNDAGRPLTAKELGYKGGVFGSMFSSKSSDEQTNFGGEPPRTSLTQPPTGYQTPAPTAPYGAGNKKQAPQPMKPEDIVTGKTY
jgi:hypothetical protein